MLCDQLGLASTGLGFRSYARLHAGAWAFCFFRHSPAEFFLLPAMFYAEQRRQGRGGPRD